MTFQGPGIRLIHTSDWHIGQELHGHSREEEHDAFLFWLIELEADVLVVTGDIYDVANPPVAAMARFYGFLRDALDRCPRLQIVVVGGNHDSAARINLPGALLGRGRVHLVGQVPRREGKLDLDALVVTLAGRDGAPAAVLGAIPFCRPGDLGRGDLAALYAEVATVAVERAAGLPVVLTGHLHVSGGDVSVDSERRRARHCGISKRHRMTGDQGWQSRPVRSIKGDEHARGRFVVKGECESFYQRQQPALQERHTVATLRLFPGRGLEFTAHGPARRHRLERPV